MKNLIKAEWFKLTKSFGFKVLLLCNAASLFTTVFLLVFAEAPGLGHRMFISALGYILHHTIIGTVFAAVFLCNEFSGRTFGTSLLCGCSRREIFLSKILVFFAGLLSLFLVYVGITTIVVSVVSGFGMEWSAKTCREVFFLLFCGMSGCVTMGAVIILVATITKKAVATIGTGIGSMYILCQMEFAFREKPLPFVKYLYTYQINNFRFMEDGFSPGMFLAVMAGTFILAMVASILIFERMELK